MTHYLKKPADFGVPVKKNPPGHRNPPFFSNNVTPEHALSKRCVIVISEKYIPVQYIQTDVVSGEKVRLYMRTVATADGRTYKLDFAVIVSRDERGVRCG